MTVLWYFSLVVDLKHLFAAGIWCQSGLKKCLHLRSPRWGGCSQCSGREGSSTASCKSEERQKGNIDSSSSVPKVLLLPDVLPVRKGGSGKHSAVLLYMVCFGQEEPSAEDERFLLEGCLFSWAGSR